MSRSAPQKRACQCNGPAIDRKTKNKPHVEHFCKHKLVIKRARQTRSPKDIDYRLDICRITKGSTVEYEMNKLTKSMRGKDLDQTDRVCYGETFCVVSKRFSKNYVHRFSATKSLFLFSPWNPLRRVAIYLCTNQYFDYIVMGTILLNCIFLAMTKPIDEAEYMFLCVYSAECVIKTVAKGFILNKYTYLRNPWNWLDFVVIASGYVTIIIEFGEFNIDIGNLAGLRTFRVLRALKTISILPGLKTIINALLNSIKQLVEVMTLTVFCLMVFALFALQVYMGVLQQKCVKNMDNHSASGEEWRSWIRNTDNWALQNGTDHPDFGSPLICGNATGARVCPEGYTCLPDIGENPNFGYTSFDNFLWSMLTTFQLITLDYWEDVYNKIIATMGPLQVVFFAIVVFFGSFYLINLMLAVVAMSYEEEAENTEEEKCKDMADHRDDSTFSFDPERLTHAKPLEKKNKNRRIVVMRRGAAIISDTFNKKKKKDEIVENNVAGSVTNGNQKAPESSSRAASLIVTPPPTTHPEGHCNVNGKQVEEIQNLHNDKKGIGSNCEPCAASTRCCTCQCHTTQPDLGLPTQDVMTLRGGCEDQRGHLRLANNTSHRQPSLDDSGVVGDHDGGDNISIQQIPNLPQDPTKGDLYSRRKCNGVSPSSPAALSASSQHIVVIEDELVDRNCDKCRECCMNYSVWLRVQNALHVVVHDAVFDLFIMICIILNTAFLAIEHHGMSDILREILDIGNKVFTAIFTLECLMKVMALSKEYFANNWNVFDLIIVLASLLDLGLEIGSGLSVLRGMRLLRVLKLAQSWKTMRVLLSIIISTLGALGNLTFVLLIIIYIFAVIGMQLFGKNYTAENFCPEPVPRWNFVDFFHSFMMIFRILCGEWVEPLWDCMRAEKEEGSPQTCLAIFLPALVVGNFMVLNLFLALLLNSFNSDELKSREDDIDDESRVLQLFVRLKNCILRRKPEDIAKEEELEAQKKLEEENKKKKALESHMPDQMIKRCEEGLDSTDPRTQNYKQMTVIAGNEDRPEIIELSDFKGDKSSPYVYSTPDQAHLQGYGNRELHEHDYRQIQFTEIDPPVFNGQDDSMSEKKQDKTAADYAEYEEGKNEEDGGFNDQETKLTEPEACCPKPCERYILQVSVFLSCIDSVFYRKWAFFRKKIWDFVDAPYFEWFILCLIFASSITLCFEDIHLDSKEELKMILNWLNLIFAILFTIEMLLKWIAFGFVRYFTSAWTILDCFIVMVSLCSLFVKQDNLIALRSLRTLRALRPLRAISRWEGMKIVVNALMYAIPSIFNVLLVCLVFWLIFSIMGVQMFGGKFYKCIDPVTRERVPTKADDNDTVTVTTHAECITKNLSWINSKINFDHVGYAYLALFQVATFEGWMEVMEDAVDVSGVGKQPEREANLYAYVYFVIFIVCGSFFTLNLFIGVIIDNFNALKKKYEGGVLEMFLTDSQKNYYTAMKKLGRKKPQKVIRRPKNHYHAIFYDIAVSRRFEISIFVLIFLNMVSMAIEHHHQSRTVLFTLEVLNALFTTIFGLEATVKIIGLRHHYFTVPWNLFDFILVFASIMGIVLQDVLTNFPISPTLLRVVRVFRIGRILRLIKAAKGIRKLLFALIVSLPALFNIGALLFLITFIYAIIGMAVFGHVQRKGALDDLVNFETFGSSMMLLFRLITSAGWNDVLDPLMSQPPDCDPKYLNQPNGNCGYPIIAIGFFVSFIIVNFMIVINMYIAVILENFNQAHKEEEIGIVEDDLEMFYVRWSKYDPHATQFINFSALSDFIASLDQPFGIPKPNTIALVSFDLPIAKGDKIHCLDILHALTKHVLGHVEETEEFKRFPPQLKMQMEEKFKKQFPTRKELEIVSSTRRWKKMDTAARVIQISWKVFLKCRKDMAKRNLLLEEAQTQTSSPGGSSIRSGFKRVSNLLAVVPMPMGPVRRTSVTVLQGRQASDRSPSQPDISSCLADLHNNLPLLPPLPPPPIPPPPMPTPARKLPSVPAPRKLPVPPHLVAAPAHRILPKPRKPRHLPVPPHSPQRLPHKFLPHPPPLPTQDTTTARRRIATWEGDKLLELPTYPSGPSQHGHPSDVSPVSSPSGAATGSVAVAVTCLSDQNTKHNVMHGFHTS
ncbi:unnamed protein product, partial [Meganyctiphanes norvegica]